MEFTKEMAVMQGYSGSHAIILDKECDSIQLTESDKDYLEIVDGSIEGSFIHHLEQGELFLSKDWAKRLGLEGCSPTEACSLMLENIHPEDRSKHLSVLLQSYHRKESKARLEFRLKVADSSYIWILGLIKIIYNETGNPIKRYGINIDITEKKMQEQALKESKQIYKALFENIEDAFQLMEPIYDEKGCLFDLRFLRVNEQYEYQTGISAEDVLGRTVREVNANVDAQWFELYSKVLKSRFSKHFEKYSQSTARWYDVLCFPCFQGNLGILFQDITEKKQTEQELLHTKEELARKAEDRYHKLINSIDEGFCVVDVLFDDFGKPVDYRILETNSFFNKHESFFGFERRLMSEIAPDEYAPWLEKLGRVVLTGEPIRFDSYVKFHGGWMSVYAFQMDNESKNNVAVLFKDITIDVMKKMELENNLQIQDQMFSNAAHELRTPLNVLLGAIQLMESQDSGESVRFCHLLKAMKQNCFRLIRLVNNIIDVSKIDSNNMNVNLRNYNIVSLVEEITISIADYAKMKGIELIFDTNEEELMMSTDSDFLERILLNLISNSLKYTDENGEISVIMQVNEESVLISIQDTGEGIPEDKLPLIFNRYEQASKQFHRRAEGTGIGLHLTKKLIDILNGSISVRSRLGEGTEFLIELPIRQLVECSSDPVVKKSLAERISIEFSDVYRN